MKRDESEINVRPAALNDREEAGALWMNLMREHEAMEPRFKLAADAALRWKNDFPLWIEDQTRRIMLAEEAGRIVGFIQAHRHVEPPVFEEVAEVYIDEIYTLPEVRGRGIGRLLLDNIKDWAGSVGARRLRFGVLTANSAGIRFWESEGAVQMGRIYTVSIQSESQIETGKPTRKLGF